jgi:LPXTG-site transpeptidase (sortase) family protein
MSRKKRSEKSLLSHLLLGAGIYLLVLGSLWHYQEKVFGFFRPPPFQPPVKPLTLPRKISIPVLALEAEIKLGGLSHGRWLTDDKAVLYLPETGRPSEGGNTILYAHNQARLFGNLKKLKTKDQIILEDESGQKFTYEVFSLLTAKPEEIIKLKSTLTNTLTLFTCDGWFDSQRLIVKAKLIPAR